MKTLSCNSMGNAMCDFVATGETDEEVVDKMMAHAKISHPEDLTKMSENDMREKMKSNIRS
jgi:predicted small metal-binding protein